jgi:DNA (cytosine-5)-methyltransferase 1
VTGKLSFELNKILDGNHIAPTIVATEADRYGVIDGGKIRRLSEKECLRLFGYPDWYSSNIKHSELYDLVGNTVVVPVIREVALKLI